MRVPPNDKLTTAPAAKVTAGKASKSTGLSFGAVLADVNARQQPDRGQSATATVAPKPRPTRAHAPVPTTTDDDDSDEQDAVKGIEAGLAGSIQTAAPVDGNDEPPEVPEALQQQGISGDE